MTDRFAVLDAYYMFASLYHGGQGSKEYAIFGRLDKLGYKPGLGASSQRPERLSEDAKEVFDRLVDKHTAPEKERITKLQTKVRGWAHRILEAAKNDAQNRAKNSKDWIIRNRLEEIQLHYNGYAEPGYTDPEHGLVATGNWNDITEWRNGTNWTISNVPSRIAKLFEKLGIETEWSDEWAECSDCGKIVRTQPDSMSWKPAYTLGEGELWCCECQEPEDIEDE